MGLLLLLASTRRSRAVRTAAAVWCGLELVRVLAIGTLTGLAAGHFPEPTVWSGYGSGYGCVPLALPPLALLWLHGNGTAART